MFRPLAYSLALLLFATAASAQVPETPDAQLPTPDSGLSTPDYEAPAHIAFVDGSATVDRDGQSQPASLNAPFVPGDRLRTTTGRVEVLFPDGTVLDVDQYTAVDLQAPALIRLTSGRIILVVAGASNPSEASRFQIDTPAASATTDGAGEYRVAILNGRTGVEAELAVLRGSGSLTTDRGSMPIRAGERAVARDGEAPSYPQAFNSARYDAFDMWAADRRNERTGAQSAQYLPQDLQMYGGTFDRYGSWEYNTPYGYVWYPSVATGWRPYYNGYWAPYRPWGWTWIGLDFWGWPTHHYGRWGFLHSRWFWIPGRSWGPAWVSWAAASDYLSWCPLGFDGRPVFGFSRGFANRYAGWTFVPRHSFGAFGRVDRFAVAPHVIPATAHFVVHNSAPVAVPRWAHNAASSTGAGRPIAVPRYGGQASSGSPGLGYAVPRQSSVVGRQSSVVGRQSSVVGRQSTVVGRQSTVNSPPSTFHSPQSRGVPSDNRRLTTPEATRSPAYAAPRWSAPAAPQRAIPAYRPPPATDYRQSIPAYRPPTADYRAVPRAPAPEYRQPTREYRPAAPDYGSRAPSMAVPRGAPAPGAGRPAGPPPSSAAPARSSGPPARSSGAPHSGESRSSGSSQGQARRR